MAEFKDEPWISSKRRRNKVNNMDSRRPSNVFVVLLLFFFVNSLTAAPFGEIFGVDLKKLLESPQQLNFCNKSNKTLNECLKSSLETFMKSVTTVFEEKIFPVLEPKLPLIKFEVGDSRVAINVNFTHFRVNGFENFKVLNVRSDLFESKLEVSFKNPHLGFSTRFAADGNFYSFPISDEGIVHLNMTDVSVVLSCHLAITSLYSGLSFLAVENCIMELTSSEINANFNNTISGSNFIGAFLKNLFENNAPEIFSSAKPAIARSFSTVFGYPGNNF